MYALQAQIPIDKTHKHTKPWKILTCPIHTPGTLLNFVPHCLILNLWLGILINCDEKVSITITLKHCKETAHTTSVSRKNSNYSPEWLPTHLYRYNIVATIFQKPLSIEANNSSLIWLCYIRKNDIDHWHQHTILGWVSSIFNNWNNVWSLLAHI